MGNCFFSIDVNIKRVKVIQKDNPFNYVLNYFRFRKFSTTSTDSSVYTGNDVWLRVFRIHYSLVQNQVLGQYYTNKIEILLYYN